MSNDLEDRIDQDAAIPIVIPDECGDSMWDAVLGQEVEVCRIAKFIVNWDSTNNATVARPSIEYKKPKEVAEEGI